MHGSRYEVHGSRYAMQAYRRLALQVLTGAEADITVPLISAPLTVPRNETVPDAPLA